MGKRQRLRREVAVMNARKEAEDPEPIGKWKNVKLGNWTVTRPTRLDMIGGYESRLYPPHEEVPVQYRAQNSACNTIASRIFFSGGKMADLLLAHGLRAKPDYDPVYIGWVVQAMVASMNVHHPHKIAVTAWLIGETTEQVNAV